MDIKVEIKEEPEEQTGVCADQQHGVMDRNPPERCPRPLDSQDGPEGNVPEKHQAENLMDIKVKVKEEETDFWDDQQYGVMNRNPPERCPRPLYSQDSPEGNVPENCLAENLMDINVEVIGEAEEETDIWADQQYGVMDRNPHERCPRPLYSQDCPEGNVVEDHQGAGLTIIKVENDEERMRGHHPCMRKVKAEIPGGVTPENPSKNSEDEDIMHRSSRENPLTLYVNPGHHSADLSYNNPNNKKSSRDQSQSVKTSTGQKGGKKFKCNECGKRFTRNSNLLTHKRIHTGEKLYSCSECGKSFTGKSNLVIHERSHTGEKPYSCSECGKCFTSKQSLITHERIHTGEKPYECSECGLGLTSKSHLLKHEKCHIGEKLYSCPVCGKCFSNKFNLATHNRSHTGEKPYLCSKCGKCFTSKSYLATHERIHTGEKPFSCFECGKCFTSKSDLGKHEKCHTGEKPYSCSECGKRFSCKSNLTSHKKCHTGKKPYSCSECGKCFSSKSGVIIHAASHNLKNSCSE